MNSRLVVFLLLALAMSWPVLAASQQSEDAAGNETEKVVEEAAEAPALASGIGWQVIRTLEMGTSGKFVHMVHIDNDRYTDKTIYSAAIHRLCSNEAEFCRVRFWNQERFIPDRISMTTQQYQQLKADHLFNRAAGIHRIEYACSVDPHNKECIAH